MKQHKGSKMEARCEWVRAVERDNEQSQKFEGKTEKDLKTVSIFAKHAFFTTEVSRHTVASLSHQNTQRQKFEKIF